MKKFIAGNWKMHGTLQEAVDLANGIKALSVNIKHDLLISPPFVHLTKVIETVRNSNLLIGAQDCSSEEQGAHTGDVSAEMLNDLGCQYVILGHSERRQNHNENGHVIGSKCKQALKSGLNVILCVGETLEQRDVGEAKDVVKKQLLELLSEYTTPENTIIAYEPVWAIGTGKSASVEDIEDMHNHIIDTIKEFGVFRVLYGGSVKPETAESILSMDCVGGALIGGASLKAESFIGIAEAVSV